MLESVSHHDVTFDEDGLLSKGGNQRITLNLKRLDSEGTSERQYSQEPLDDDDMSKDTSEDNEVTLTSMSSATEPKLQKSPSNTTTTEKEKPKKFKYDKETVRAMIKEMEEDTAFSLKTFNSR